MSMNSAKMCLNSLCMHLSGSTGHLTQARLLATVIVLTQTLQLKLYLSTWGNIGSVSG